MESGLWIKRPVEAVGVGRCGGVGERVGSDLRGQRGDGGPTREVRGGLQRQGGADGIRDGLLMVLASKVTEPVRASALPANIVSVCSVMEA